MLQNYPIHNRPKHQIQTPSVSSTYAYILDEGGGSSSPSQSMLTNNMEEDDDDICPVCESECTCANRSRNSVPAAPSLPVQGYHNGYAPPAAAQRADSGAQAHSTLKIKLTLPPRPQAPHVGGNSVSVRPSAPKKKSRNLVEATFAGGNVGGYEGSLVESSFSAFDQPLDTGNGIGGYLNADGTVPKKRGRPTKAVVAAREAAKVAGPTGARPADTDIRLSIENVGFSRHVKQTSYRKTSAPPKVTSAKKKGKMLHGAAAASRAKAQLRKAQQQQQQQQPLRQPKKKRQSSVKDYESSELSELDDDNESDNLHFLGLPTFISAFSSSSNESSSDSDSGSDADKEDQSTLSLNAGTLPVEANEHALHKRTHRDWEIHVRKRSVGVDGNSDAEMDAESDDDDEADGEKEEEEEEYADGFDEDANGPGVQRLMRYAGVATGWTDDEGESSFDADLFFANLSDSTADASDDDQMGDVEDGFAEDEGRDDESMDVTSSGFSAGLDVMRLSEVAAAGFLSPFADLERGEIEHLPFGQGWDHILLSNTFKDSLLEFADSQPNRSGQALENSIPGFEEADAMMATSEEEEAVAMFDNDDPQDPEEEDGVEIFDVSDDGDTTEDEYVDVDGITMPRNLVLLRFPASLGAIDPMSTVSSPIRAPDGRCRTLSTISSFSGNYEPSKPTPKPGDILSGKACPSENKENLNSSLDNTSVTEFSVVPAMGSFVPQATDKTKRVVIASSGGVAPCPYPAIRRLRRRADSLGKLNYSGSDAGSGNSRPSSLFSSTRSPFEAVGSSFESTDDTDLPSIEPIQLDDVLDAAFLESQPTSNVMPDSTASETGESDTEGERHLQRLQRWDHIPIDAFRKSRTAGTVGDLALIGVDKMVVVPPTLRAPRPADGFSYGSAAGGMLRGSPLNTALWESNGAGTGTRSNLQKGKGRGGKIGRMSVVISPVLLPTRDGDRTPTSERHQHQHHQQQQQQQQHTYLGFSGHHAAQHAQNVKSRKELRKEKKRNRKFFGSATANVRHHFPNAKSRSQSGVQRSNHGSIPSLSI